MLQGPCARLLGGCGNPSYIGLHLHFTSAYVGLYLNFVFAYIARASSFIGACIGLYLDHIATCVHRVYIARTSGSPDVRIPPLVRARHEKCHLWNSTSLIRCSSA